MKSSHDVIFFITNNNYYKEYSYLWEFNSVDRDIVCYMQGLRFEPRTPQFSTFKCVSSSHRLLDQKKIKKIKNVV